MKQLILFFTLLFAITISAQPGERVKERIKAQKTAFITNQLNLTAEEAQVFWPIYNAFEAETEELKFVKLRNIHNKLRNNSNMSSAEADKLLEEFILAEKSLFDAKLRLYNKLKGVIPSIKILKLKRAEDEFNRRLLQKLKEMRKNRPNRDRP